MRNRLTGNTLPDIRQVIDHHPVYILSILTGYIHRIKILQHLVQPVLKLTLKCLLLPESTELLSQRHILPGRDLEVEKYRHYK